MFGNSVAQAFVLLSSCYHNLSKYESSQHAAERAYAISRSHGFRQESIHGLAQSDEALRMQLYPNLPVPRPWSPVRALRYALLMVRFALDVFRIERLSRSLGNDQGGLSSQSPRHVALEHRIRLYAMLQGALRSALGSEWPSRLLDRYWAWIWRESYRVGYAAGIANALQYRDRLARRAAPREEHQEVDITEIVSAIEVYQFINHRNGLALALRDQADTVLAHGRADQAATLYARCVELARVDENASVELKGLLGLRRCGERIDAHRVEHLLNSIEGDGYRQMRKALTRFVAG